MARRETTLKEDPRKSGKGKAETTRMHLVVSSPTASRIYDLDMSEILLVGRSKDVRITVDDLMVSRLHLQVERREDGVYIQDRGSANGTWLNGKRVDDRVGIHPGDEVKIGSTVLSLVEATTLPHYQRSIMPAADFHTRLANEIESSKEIGVPLSLLYIRMGEFGQPLPLLTEKLMDVLGPGDQAGHQESTTDLLVLLPGASRLRAEALVRKFISHAFESRKDVRGIGLAVFPDDGVETSTLVSRARVSSSKRGWAVPQTTGPLRPDGDASSITRVSGITNDPDPEKGFVVRDPAMQNLIKVSRKVAAADVPVLILGETGAGKEVLAHYIHESSNRSAAPFVKVHCASLPPGLIESELFGHEKGAFTGADDERQGFFETALGGTLVLDEITELPGTVQVKLLRFLDDLTIHRVGSSREIHLDVRILALTNRDIEQEVRGGRFRQDLYYRLSTFVLFVPPLRGRLADIPVLAHYFANRAARRVGSPAPELSEEFMDCLRAHSWPGNVREIRNVVESAMILSDDEVLLAEHLPEHVRGGGSKPSSAPDSVEPIRQRKEAAEEEEIRKALDRTGGNQTAAARILGVSRRTLWSKVRQYGIEIKKGG